MIIDTFAASGVPVTEFVVAGGLLKDAFVMQIYADVLRRPLSVIGSDQGPALGSAIHAAVAAGAYPDVPAAAAAMGRQARGGLHARTRPAPTSTTSCTPSTCRLHDYFGRGAQRGACTGCARCATGCWREPAAAAGMAGHVSSEPA